VNCVDRTGINTCAAVDAGIGVNGTLAASFADSIYGTGIIACTAVDAFFGNRVSQGIHLLLFFSANAVKLA
jgi:hypothetical protein